MKYKVGDKVFLKKSLIKGKKYGAITYSFILDQFVDNPATIARVNTESGNYLIAKEAIKQKGRYLMRGIAPIDPAMIDKERSYAGDTFTAEVTIKKVKKGNATVIEINGQRYILDHKDRYRGNGK